MKVTIQGDPSFSHVHVDLESGETVTAESGAMQSMSAELDMKAVTNGGFFSALGKKWFGGESFIVNRFTNNDTRTRRVTIAQDLPDQIIEEKMTGGREMSLQKGAYLGHLGDIKLKVSWAGFISWFSGEELIKLRAKAVGNGAMMKRTINGDLKVDDGHLVAYGPGLKLELAMAGGLFTTIFGGEGLVTRVVGNGDVYIQTRSIKGLAAWLNPKFR